MESDKDVNSALLFKLMIMKTVENEGRGFRNDN